jgi:hydrogenase maturation protease
LKSTGNKIVIGIGSEYRGDDAVGLLAARRTKELGLQDVTVLEQDGDGAQLMEAWSGARVVMIIDAAGSGAPAGTVHRFEANADPLPAHFSHHSTHAFGLAEAIELARALGQLPERVIIYGIEARNFAAGTGISPEVRAALDRVVDDLVRFVNSSSASR